MKKQLPLTLVFLSIFIFSALSFAQSNWDNLFTNYDPENEKLLSGLDIGWEVSTTDYKNIAKIPAIYGNEAQTYTEDIVSKTATERSSIVVDTVAFIPTYVKLELSGNSGKSTVHAFGPFTVGNSLFENALIFDNEIGGFIDENWNSLGHGEQLSIAPDKNRYIQASDYLKAVIFSNDNYKYEVTASPLLATSESAIPNASLSLEMAYSTLNANDSYGDWQSFTFTGINSSEMIAQKSALQTLTVMHRFRVPYNNEVAAGKYTGKIHFKVYTL